MSRQLEINKCFENKGVKFIDINNTYISKETTLGKNVTIYPNVHIEGQTIIGDNCVIYPGSFLVNATIGNNCNILSSRITDSKLGNNIEIGPNSHLRMGCVIGDDCRIGNFVEMKNTEFGKGSKCAHLTYLGDSIIGKNVNVGCGVVTVNYDGKNKHKTIVHDNCFIGSNVNLIAPIEIGDYAVLAAGSTITKNVESKDMAIARKKEEIKKGYGYKYLKKEKYKDE